MIGFVVPEFWSVAILPIIDGVNLVFDVDLFKAKLAAAASWKQVPIDYTAIECLLEQFFRCQKFGIKGNDSECRIRIIDIV